MTEEFLHYIWKYKYFHNENLRTEDYKAIEIISVGLHNQNAGPDFFNAKIKINDTLWVGNIEIHINSSDWEKHLHHENDDYNNVILHVVYYADSKTYNQQKQEIPVLSIQFDEKLYQNYLQIKNNPNTIACSNSIKKVDNFTILNWLDKLLIERLEQKTQIIENLLEQTKNDWNECFYIFLARGFGGNINSFAFEALAKSLPQRILAKHKNNLFQLEALLFGQAGMLNSEDKNTKYYSDLKKEYDFLKAKYKLQSIETYYWKFLRLRPINFPTLRISQFAQLIHQSNSLLTSILSSTNFDNLAKLFSLKTSVFWETHYTFVKESSQKKKSFGKNAIENIIINSIVPFLFIYGKKKTNTELQEKAIALLDQMKAEKNKVVSDWQTLGLQINTAYQSQASIQMMNEYCKPGKCTECAIGNQILSNCAEIS